MDDNNTDRSQSYKDFVYFYTYFRPLSLNIILNIRHYLLF